MEIGLTDGALHDNDPIANLLFAHANSASSPHRDETLLVSYVVSTAGLKA